MVGAYTVIVENKYLKYEFVIRRNITIVRGNSATGKTTLIEMIREFNQDEKSGVNISCEKQCVVLEGRNWLEDLRRMDDSIVFIDENSRFTNSYDFASAIKGTNNYYVIVTREKLSNLPYSIEEIYGIRENGRYARLTSEYTENRFYQLYGNRPNLDFGPEEIITEDEGSGNDFWKELVGNTMIKCLAAGGKDRVIKVLRDASRSKRKLVVVDGAAFGAEMEEVMTYINLIDANTKLFAPESFEYLLLNSDLFPGKEIGEILENTQDYADSREYMSWEQFYTKLIVDLTEGTKMQYTKSKLNDYYLSERNMEIVKRELPKQVNV